MLAGAGGIDFALLVVAADDGPMPQTAEHLAILDLLGLTRGAVALTKADLADPARRAAAAAEIRALLARTGLAGAPILPVSALTGEGHGRAPGLSRGRGALRRRCAPAAGLLRLPVDRAFTLAGAGTVVTGTLVCRQRRGRRPAWSLSPSGLARPRPLGPRPERRRRSAAPRRPALRAEPRRRRRDPRRDRAAATWCSTRRCTHRPTGSTPNSACCATEPKPLGAWFPARLHTGATEVGARIVPLGAPLAPGATGPSSWCSTRRSRLRCTTASSSATSRPAAPSAAAASSTCAPPRAGARTPERLATAGRCRRIRSGPARSCGPRSRSAPVDLAAFARDRACRRRSCGGRAASAPSATAPWHLPALPALDDGLAATLSAFHAENPELAGAGPRAAAPRADAAARQATPSSPSCRPRPTPAALVLEGAFVRLPATRPGSRPTDEALWAAIAPGLGGAARFRPPRVRDCRGRPRARRARGPAGAEALRPHGPRRRDRPGPFLPARHHRRDGRAGRRRGERRPPAAGSPPRLFRDRMDNGRKVAIQILDFLDRHGVTLRRGDLRRINPHRLDLFGPG